MKKWKNLRQGSFTITDFVKQVKEMGVNIVIVGGDTEVIYSDPSILQKYTKVE